MTLNKYFSFINKIAITDFLSEHRVVVVFPMVIRLDTEGISCHTAASLATYVVLNPFFFSPIAL